MVAITPGIIMMFAVSVVFQVIGILLMPMTKGLTEIMPTLGSALAFLVGLGAMARIIHSGINLSILAPFMAAIVPICIVTISIFIYGESASLTKISLLLSACFVIGFASNIA